MSKKKNKNVISNVNLATYARLQILLTGITDPTEGEKIVVGQGVSVEDWDRAAPGFEKRIQKSEPWSKFTENYTRFYRQAFLDIKGPSPKKISMEQYAEATVGFQTGVGVDEVLTPLGIDWDGFTHVGFEWMEIFDKDKKLGVYFNLKVQKLYAEKTGKKPESDYIMYVPGNLIRTFSCENCGSIKISKPTHTYIYCDYCASLIGYDGSVLYEDPTSLDEMMVGDQLLAVCEKELVRTRETKDVEGYSAIRYFMAEVTTEVCPKAFPPRISDPEYRDKYIYDWSVPITVATMFDEAWILKNRELKELSSKFYEKPSYGKALKLFNENMKMVEYEASIYQRENLLEKCPDDITPEFYMKFNRMVNVHILIPHLKTEDQKRLIEAASLPWEYMEIPKVNTKELRCGQCSTKVTIPEDATKTLCHSCGYILDIVHHQFQCIQCGGGIIMPKGKSEATCGYCGTRWSC